ncbi:extracellular ligand-binding receptor [Desulfovibrio sp. X2]|uniref:ABC transporter substrate-binding protein n=1 Tax=Desulfovibrio sp. X2 TaxID=941449 RepID=UPI0003587FA6|nr:ABC transporter substrate-binding protein [Desulfovibrio sp. X2]EPR37311.1 extracellular ligand-binding receptor [Desulfovibrio sp. X2]
MPARLLRLLAAAMLALSLLVLAACGSGPPVPAHPQRVPGVSKHEIRIGSSLALSGHAEYLGIQTLRGALSYIDYVNEHGGVHGRTIRVVAYDDAYDPTRCLVNTQRLIVSDDVFSLFCYVGTPTTLKVLPLIEQAKIPLVGTFTGANALRVPFNPLVVNVRASYYQETAAAVKHMVEDLGLSRIAVFYQYDAYGFDGLTGTELALKKYGLAPVARGSYIRGTLNIEDGLDKIMRSGAQAVVMIGTYDPCAVFIQEARKHGFDPLFYTVSFVGGEELGRRLPRDGDSLVILSQVVPPPAQVRPPQGGPHDPGYAALLARYYPADKPNFIGQEGYFNAQVLVEGLRRAGRDLTREGFLKAIESMEDFPLAESLSVSFSPTDHQGLDQVYFTRLTHGDFRLIENWDEVRRILAEKSGKAAKPADRVPPAQGTPPARAGKDGQ